MNNLYHGTKSESCSNYIFIQHPHKETSLLLLSYLLFRSVFSEIYGTEYEFAKNNSVDWEQMF